MLTCTGVHTPLSSSRLYFLSSPGLWPIFCHLETSWTITYASREAAWLLARGSDQKKGWLRKFKLRKEKQENKTNKPSPAVTTYSGKQGRQKLAYNPFCNPFRKYTSNHNQPQMKPTQCTKPNLQDYRESQRGEHGVVWVRTECQQRTFNSRSPSAWTPPRAKGWTGTHRLGFKKCKPAGELTTRCFLNDWPRAGRNWDTLTEIKGTQRSMNSGLLGDDHSLDDNDNDRVKPDQKGI